MSETVALPEAFIAVPPPPVRGASPADINEMGEWLIPRMVEHWSTTTHQVTTHHARGYLLATLNSNEQRLIVCGDSIGMAHIEPGRMGLQCRVIVDFTLSKFLADGVDGACEILAWFQTWAKGLQASGLFRVDDFTDIPDRSFIRSRIGKLTKRESFNAIF